jgi:hypothetical protein
MESTEVLELEAGGRMGHGTAPDKETLGFLAVTRKFDDWTAALSSRLNRLASDRHV